MSQPNPPELQINVNSRRYFTTGNPIHPVEVDSSPPPLSAASTAVNRTHLPFPFRKIKHFEMWFPWLIPVFIVADTVVFIITMYVNNCPKNADKCIPTFLGRFSFQPFRENPLLGPSSLTLWKMGALDVSKVLDDHQWWRLITCIWLHGGFFHLLPNMLNLLVIGIRLEFEFGFIRVGLLYVISGLGGSLLSVLFIQPYISLGASSAVCGLLGGMVSELITNWTMYTDKLVAVLTILVLMLMNLAIGVFPHVDSFAHKIGGFLSGFLLGFVFLMQPNSDRVSRRYPPSYSRAGVKSKYKTYQLVLWLLSLILLVVGLVAALELLERGVDLNDYCSWCHHMSCVVTTSKWSCDPVPCRAEQGGDQFT